MIDVVFLLLVFFMLASRFGLDQVMPLALAGAGGTYDGPPRLIDVTPDGMRLNGVTISAEALTGALSALVRSPDDMLILRRREQATLQRIVTVTDALRAAGFRSIVLVEEAMNLPPATRRVPTESIVPMINVIFLLLIFFLMTSQVAPPVPIEIAAPGAKAGDDPGAELKLYLDAQGEPYLGQYRGEAVFAALGREVGEHRRILLAADRQVEAARPAAALRRLAATGVAHVELIVAPD